MSLSEFTSPKVKTSKIDLAKSILEPTALKSNIGQNGSKHEKRPSIQKLELIICSMNFLENTILIIKT